jgi:hypothetical protein
MAGFVKVLLRLIRQRILLRLCHHVLFASELVLNIFHDALRVHAIILLNIIKLLIIMVLLPASNTIVKHLSIFSLLVPLLLIVFWLCILVHSIVSHGCMTLVRFSH